VKREAVKAVAVCGWVAKVEAVACRAAMPAGVGGAP